ncbi:MAG: NAD(P)-binding protein, partial [Planctomycetales bacterium]
WRILRKSLDARSRERLEFVYTLTVELADEESRREKLLARENVDAFAPAPFDDPPPGTAELAERPVIVGSGPAGLLAGYYLAERGYRPLIIERGQPVKERVPAIRAFDRGGTHDPENNYLFGEGGAGCFSDGKLTCRLSGPDVDWVLERFVECGGKPSLLYESRPHLGSNRLPLICRNFRRGIEALGGEYRFGCRLEGIDVAGGHIRGIATSSGYIAATQVVLGIGHSARDTYRMLHALGVPMIAKAFQLGLRIEQPQAQVDRHKYGKRDYVEVLGAADYTLVARGRRDLFTFCMCAGGIVIPSISEPEMFCSNGMSNSRHDTSFANSGLVVTLGPEEFGSDHPLAGMELQRKFEAAAFRLAGSDYLSPIQTANDFVAGRAPDSSARLDCSYQRGTRPVELDRVIPEPVARAIREGLPVMDRKWRGGFLKNAVLVGPEMRGSSPIRIARDEATRETPGFAGLYPVGEGAGYAGGIVTAGVDGLRSARKIVERFAPLARVPSI